MGSMRWPSESEVSLDSPELILWCFDLLVVDSLNGCSYNLQYTYQFRVMQIYNDQIYCFLHFQEFYDIGFHQISIKLN